MSSKFEIFKDKAGEFRFHLKASNGQIILASEGYTQKESAVKGIESVCINSPIDEHYDRKTAKDGQYMFNLKAANGQIIGTSELYKAEASMEKGIESVKKNAPNASIDDLSA